MVEHNIEWINPYLAEAIAPVREIPGFLVYALTAPLPGSDKPNKVPCNPDTGRIEPPNDPTSRGVLTYREAEARAAALGEKYGVGMHPAKFPGLVALDFDGCVRITGDGDIHVDQWVTEIVKGEAYAEVSPSMTGLRVLLLDPAGHLKRLATGFERHSVGVYGAPGSGKFVTLTGMAIEQSAPAVGEAPGVVSRVLDYFASKLGAERVASGGLDYPMGMEGVAEAEEDILSGASLHPAMMRVVTGLMNTTMPAQEIREHLIGLMQRSKARGTSRWAARMKGIDGATGIMAWVAGRHGERAQDRPGEGQRKAIARGLVERFSGRWSGSASVGHSGGLDDGKASPAVNGVAYRPLLDVGKPDSLEVTEQEQLAAQRVMVLGAPWDFDTCIAYFRSEGGDPDALATELVADFAGEAAREALAEALKDEPQVEADWEMIERAPAGLRGLMEVALRGLPREYPEMAAMAVLSALSAATGNGFVVKGLLGNVTPLSLYTVALAPSGALKSYVEGFISMVIGAAGHQKDAWPGSHQGFRDVLRDRAFKEEGEGDATVAKWPVMTILAGEIGMKLQGLSAGRGKQAGHEDAVMALLFDLTNMGTAWGTKPGGLEAQRIASKIRPKVENPYVTMAGFSTSTAYYGGLTREMVAQGLGNRFLVFSSEYEVENRPLDYEMPEGLPADVIEALEALSLWTYPERRTGATGQLARGLRRPEGKPWHRPQWMITLPQRLFQRFYDEEAVLRAAFAKAGLPEVMVARFYETAVKVAGLAAVWEVLPLVAEMQAWSAPIEITDEQAEYGCWLVSRLLFRSGQEYVAKSDRSPAIEHAERLQKIMLRALANPGDPVGEAPARRASTAAHLEQGNVPRGFLMRASRLSAKDFEMATAHLEAAEFCVPTNVPRSGGGKGKEAVVYRLFRE